MEFGVVLAFLSAISGAFSIKCISKDGWNAVLDIPRLNSPEKEMLSSSFINCNNSTTACVFGGAGYYLKITITEKYFNSSLYEFRFHLSASSRLHFVVHHIEQNQSSYWTQHHEFMRKELWGASNRFAKQFLSFAGDFGKVEQLNVTLQLIAKNEKSKSVCSLSLPVRVKLQEYCPIGYHVTKASEKLDIKSCFCDESKEADKNGILACRWDGGILSSPGYWLGYDETKLSGTYYKWCPLFYCHCASSSGCWLDIRDCDQQCSEGHHGILCGQCKKGYVASVGYSHSHCLKLKNKTNGATTPYDCTPVTIGVMIGIMVSFSFVIVAVSIAVNLDVNAGYLPPLVFYYQMVGFTIAASLQGGLLRTDKIGLLVVILYLADYVNFYFPFGNLCIEGGSEISTWNVAILYLPPAFVFVFMIIFAVIARKLSRVARIRVLRPFWSLLTLTYPNFAYTSLMILHCVPLSNGQLHWYYGAHYKCFTGTRDRLIYEIVAIVCLGLYVLPLPFFVAFGIGSKRIHRLFPVADVSLQSFKDTCWWAEGLNFGRRLSIILGSCFLSYMGKNLGYSFFLVILIVILAIHTQVQPYARNKVNHLETILLVNLCFVAVFQLPLDFPSDDASPIAAAFFFIPYLIGFIYLFYWIYDKVRRKCKKKYQESLEESPTLPPSNNQAEETQPQTIPLSEKQRYKGSSILRGGSLPNPRRSFDPDEMMNENKFGLRDPLLEKSTGM